MTDPTGTSHPSLNAEMAAYERMRSLLETEHFGKWVIIRDEELAGSYDEFQTAASTAVERFGRGPYLLRRVGAGPLTLLSSVLYGPPHG